jgi:hypothetical protein
MTDNFHYIKDPESDVDLVIDYSGPFSLTDPADTIATSIWRLEACQGATGLVLGDETETGTQAVQWVSGGGILGSFYKLINTMVSVGRRTIKRTILIEIRNK